MIYITTISVYKGGVEDTQAFYNNTNFENYMLNLTKTRFVTQYSVIEIKDCAFSQGYANGGSGIYINNLNKRLNLSIISCIAQNMFSLTEGGFLIIE
jgi:predicted transcriptional regulator